MYKKSSSITVLGGTSTFLICKIHFLLNWWFKFRVLQRHPVVIGLIGDSKYGISSIGLVCVCVYCLNAGDSTETFGSSIVVLCPFRSFNVWDKVGHTDAPPPTFTMGKCSPGRVSQHQLWCLLCFHLSWPWRHQPPGWCPDCLFIKANGSPPTQKPLR